MKKLIGIISLVLGFVTNVISSESVTLAWCPSPGTNINGYLIYFSAGPVITNWTPSVWATNAPCGAAPISEGSNWYRTYTNSVSVGNVTNATITGLLPGSRYYFAATAKDTDGLESELSNEVMYLVPYPTVKYTFSLSSVNNVVTRGLQAQLVFTADTTPSTNVFLQITYSGTAQQGVDYAIVTNVYVFPQGTMSYTQYIGTIANTVPDTNKTLSVTLLSSTDYNVGNSNVNYTLVPVDISYTNTLPTRVKDFQLLKMK